MNPHRSFALALFAWLLVPTAGAAERDVAFDLIQSQCVGAGTLSRAALGDSAACAVTRGRWFSTIEHDDFYQAQYCLRATAEAAKCQKRALLLFANRAYTPTARLTLERIDPAGTTYDDPQVHLTPDGYVMRLTVRPPRGAPQTTDYRWQDDRWQAVKVRRLTP